MQKTGVKLKDIKNWNTDIEKTITASWKSADQFSFDPKTKKKIYSIDTPPPYVNTPIHMGHAITYAYMDFFARYKRMKGFEVLFPLGLDRNGLPIEMAAEKKFKISPFKVGRKKFVEYCEKLLAEASEESIDSFARLGISFSSYKKGEELGQIYLTDSPEYRKLTQATFIDLYKKGFVYEDKRINNWDPKLQTTIADSEIEYKEIPSTFNHVTWKVKETGETIIISTTRPELICTCGMVIYNPSDERYKHLKGKTAISPVFEKEIPIKEHPFADPEKGSGIVMMCSAGDLTDIQFFREQNLKPTIAINKNGTMNEHAEMLEGLKVKEAREKIISLLKEKGHLDNQENITHRTPVSERSSAEIEFIEMSEYYCKQLDFLEDMKKIANKVSFYPKESKAILDRWIDSILIDWPISRRRYYATPVPAWYATDEEGNTLTALPKKGEYYEPWKETVPDNAEVFKGTNKVGSIKDHKQLDWQGDQRVFDTWFDSSISELNMIQYPSDFAKKAYPVSLRPQGKEIVRTWLYYTLLRGFHEVGKPAFEDVWIHQHILDGKGRKMSKSVGNVIDPQQIIANEGVEALRLWAALEGDLSRQDLSCSRDRIRAENKTLNKLLNVARFIMQFEKPAKKPTLTETDKHFIAYVEYLTQFTDQQYEKYDFHNPAEKIRHFLWELFASHYIELVKTRAYNEEKTFSQTESSSSHYTLHYALERILYLLNPIIPQITAVVSEALNSSLDAFPKTQKVNDKAVSLVAKKLTDFNSYVWKEKKEKGLSLRSEIKEIKIPKELKDFEKDLIACHNLV